MTTERRKERSEFSDLALHYWLKAEAQHHGLDNLVLADPAGMLIAASQTNASSEAVAASAPFVQAEMPVPEGIGDQPDAVHPVDVDGQPLFICPVGGKPTVESWVEHTATGVRRILRAD